jgi:hypothetical protein
LGRALQDWDADGGDDEHADEGHLEASSKELGGVEDEQSHGRSG